MRIGLLKRWRKTHLLANHFMAHLIMLQRQRKGQDSHLTSEVMVEYLSGATAS